MSPDMANVRSHGVNAPAREVKQPVRAVIFDLGRTLVPFSFERLERDLRDCRPAVFEAAARYERGQISSNDFRAQLCHLTGIEAAGFAEWWNSIFSFEPLIDEALIRALMRRYRVGLLSNTNALHFEFVRQRMPLLEEFSFTTLSYRVGATKPDEAIFADAERQAGVARKRILYFDDFPEYVEAARRRGWNAYVFTGQPSVEATLTHHAIDWKKESAT